MSLTKPVHPACGKKYPGGDGHGHCAVCCETFAGQGAFDAHFSRDEHGNYLHREPVEIEDQWWLDTNGYWHKGKRLTAEQKEQRWGSKS